MHVLLPHAARRPWSWLISDVRQKTCDADVMVSKTKEKSAASACVDEQGRSIAKG
jgi:hypothetical protein